MTIRTSWPSAVRAFGRLPATPPRPPNLARGYASAEANRIFIEISAWTCGLDLTTCVQNAAPPDQFREALHRLIRSEPSLRTFPPTSMQRAMPPTKLGH